MCVCVYAVYVCVCAFVCVCVCCVQVFVKVDAWPSNTKYKWFGVHPGSAVHKLEYFSARLLECIISWCTHTPPPPFAIPHFYRRRLLTFHNGTTRKKTSPKQFMHLWFSTSSPELFFKCRVYFMWYIGCLCFLPVWQELELGTVDCVWHELDPRPG